MTPTGICVRISCEGSGPVPGRNLWLRVLVIIGCLSVAAPCLANLALNQPATSSGADASSSAGDAFDGDPSTGWISAPGVPQWVEVDLGSECFIDSMRLIVDQATDGSYLGITVVGRTSTGSSGGLVGYAGHPTTGDLIRLVNSNPVGVRYIRIVTTQANVRAGWREVEVYGRRAEDVSIGYQLSWSHCSQAQADLVRFDTCDGSDDYPATIWASAVPRGSYFDFIGASATFDIHVASESMPAFWEVINGGCRDAGVGWGTIGGSSTVACANPYSGAGQGGGMILELVGPNQLRLRGDWARDQPGRIIGWRPNRMVAVLIQQGPTEVSCAGCEAPACVELSSLLIWDMRELGGDALPPRAGGAAFVSWQGGGVAGAICPGATQATSRSWGAVKSLYR